MARCEDPIRVMKGRHGGELGYRVTIAEGYGRNASASYYYPDDESSRLRGSAYVRELNALAEQVAPHLGETVADVEQNIEGILRSGESVPLPPASPTE